MVRVVEESVRLGQLSGFVEVVVEGRRQLGVGAQLCTSLFPDAQVQCSSGDLQLRNSPRSIAQMRTGGREMHFVWNVINCRKGAMLRTIDIYRIYNNIAGIVVMYCERRGIA